LGVNPSKKAAGSIMILGGAGSGKTNNIIYPTILKSLQNTMKPTMIVTDPKGELFDLTANTAELNGYNVINFGKSTFNPLAQL
jgi:type IV secretion system protein VirD4